MVAALVSLGSSSEPVALGESDSEPVADSARVRFEIWEGSGSLPSELKESFEFESSAVDESEVLVLEADESLAELVGPLVALGKKVEVMQADRQSA